MRVILVKPVRKLGKIGDVVKVKDGFGRNFLLTHGFAVRATDSNMLMIEEKRHELEAKNAADRAAAEVLGEKIQGKDVTFIMQAAVDGRLFGSVSNKELAKAVSALGYEINHAQVALEQPLKSLGVFEVPLNLHSDVTIHIIVNIARSDSEAGDALRDFKQGKVQGNLLESAEIEGAEENVEAEDSALSA
ncbi:MAG: 50S ribosomal protein L9 [Pseudomonadota bacterium]